MIIDPQVLSRASSYVRVFIHTLTRVKTMFIASYNSKRKGLDLAETLGIKSSIAEKMEFKPIHLFGELGVLSGLVSPKKIKEISKKNIKVITAIEKVPHTYKLLHESVPLINGDKAYNLGYTGKNVRVAILDTGIDRDHPDLRNKIVYEKSFTPESPVDYDSHGTHVAGIVASHNSYYRGVSPDVELVNAKVIGSCGTGHLDDMLAGLLWAINNAGAEIVNISLGALTPPSFVPIIYGKAAKLLHSFIKKGILFFAAAGNAGESGPDSITFPAIVPGVIAVAATDKNGKVTEYSGEGSSEIENLVGELKPNIAAPGGAEDANIKPQQMIISSFTTKISNYYRRKYSFLIVDNYHIAKSGTSMAAPHATGVAALLLERMREIGIAKTSERYPLVYGALKETACDTGASKYKQGYGLIDAEKALKEFGKYRAKIPELPPEFKSNLETLFKKQAKTRKAEDQTAILLASLLGAGIGVLVGAILTRYSMAQRTRAKELLDKLKLAESAYQAGLISREDYELYRNHVYEELKKIFYKNNF